MIHATRAQRRQLARDNDKLPDFMLPVPRQAWPIRSEGPEPVAVFRSRRFLAQVFDAHGGVLRISVCTTTLTTGGRWEDGITWDELQQIKREIGFGGRDAVEVYPPDRDVVNVANMRHLWVMPVGERLPFALRAA